MLPCLRQSSSSTTNTQFSQSAVDGISSDQTTPSSVNLSREYDLAIQTASYIEIRSKIHCEVSSYWDEDAVNFQEEPLEVGEVLKPSQECIKKAFSSVSPDALSQLVGSYFEHSEQTTQLCLFLSHCIHRAHRLYSPLHKLLDLFSSDLETVTDSLSRAQCDWAFDAFLEFEKLDNPFPSPDSLGFSNMSSCFTQLKEHLEIHLQKSRSKVQLLRCATKSASICLIVTTFGVVISAIVIAAHALIGLIAVPACPLFSPSSKMTKKEMARLVQLDDAAKGIFVLHSHLETVDCLVARLHNAMEDYKRLVRFGIERGNDTYPIHEVVLQLQKKHNIFLEQLNGLEEHLCICFAAINRARSLLLDYFLLHSS